MPAPRSDRTLDTLVGRSVINASSSGDRVVLRTLRDILEEFRAVFSTYNLALSLGSSIRTLVRTRASLDSTTVSRDLPSCTPFTTSLDFTPESHGITTFSIDILVVSLVTIVKSNGLSFVYLDVIRAISVAITVFIRIYTTILDASARS